jgi:hypothetical protein
MPAKTKPVATIGNNFKAMLAGVRDAAAAAGHATAILTMRLRDALAANLSDDMRKTLQREAYIGAIAGKYAASLGRAVVPEDFATATVILAKADVSAKAPNKYGQRNANETRWYVAARVMFSAAMDAAGYQKNPAKVAAGKALAAKRKARAGGAGTTLTKGATVKAVGSKTSPAPQPAVAFASKSEALAGAMQYASAIKTLAETNAKHLGKSLRATLDKAADMILTLPM